MTLDDCENFECKINFCNSGYSLTVNTMIILLSAMIAVNNRMDIQWTLSTLHSVLVFTQLWIELQLLTISYFK